LQSFGNEKQSYLNKATDTAWVRDGDICYEIIRINN
jgi:hypothetical protein